MSQISMSHLLFLQTYHPAPAGITHVEVNDGRNMSERIYSDERIYIDMDNAPDSVELMSTLSINKGLKSLGTVADSRVDTTM